MTLEEFDDKKEGGPRLNYSSVDHFVANSDYSAELF